MPYWTPVQKPDEQSKERLCCTKCEKCLQFISANTDGNSNSEPTNSQTNIANLNVCHPRFVCITPNNKDTTRHFTGLYNSYHKLFHVSAVQGSHLQAVIFRNVKKKNCIIFSLCFAESSSVVLHNFLLVHFWNVRSDDGCLVQPKHEAICNYYKKSCVLKYCIFIVANNTDRLNEISYTQQNNTPTDRPKDR